LEEGSTQYMILLALFYVFLAKISGQEDIIVGTPVAGRTHDDLKKIIGMFVNTLALRNHPTGDLTLTEFLKKVKEKTLRAFENQEYPFEDLVDKVDINRDVSRNPLFDVMFSLYNVGTPENTIDTPHASQNDKPGEPAITATTPTTEKKQQQHHATQNTFSRTSKFDMTLIGAEQGDGLSFQVEYCTGIFTEETIHRFVSYFGRIITAVVEEPGVTLSQIEILREDEKRKLLYDFNNAEREYPQHKTIHGLFSEQAAKTPGNTALVGPTRQEYVTYGELQNRARKLAGKLREKGIAPGTIAAILVERSVNMVVGLLAIMEAGGTYLPIEPVYPEERIKYMLDDSNAKILLTTHALMKKIPPGKNSLYFEELKEENPDYPEPPAAAAPQPASRTAYIIYTSGSTGRPKGVLIRHKGFINLVYNHRQEFAEDSRDRMSQVASPGFDAMAFEVWPCLLSGAALYIAGDEIRVSPSRLKRWLIDNKITLTFQSTLMGEQLLKEEWPETGVSLRALRVAGDRLRNYPQRTYPFRLYNLYGPTEDTVWTTCTKVTAIPDPVARM
ncbi:MAG: AMP-binding protein, partial [bacterium]|nr:AMP-binding protein [bacterium]